MSRGFMRIRIKFILSKPLQYAPHIDFGIKGKMSLLPPPHKKDSVFKSICTYRVFGALEGNRAVYFDTVSSIIESAVSGFNATIFAYGQEGLNSQ